jgi:hypothetical protein
MRLCVRSSSHVCDLWCVVRGVETGFGRHNRDFVQTVVEVQIAKLILQCNYMGVLQLVQSSMCVEQL